MDDYFVQVKIRYLKMEKYISVVSLKSAEFYGLFKFVKITKISRRKHDY